MVPILLSLLFAMVIPQAPYSDFFKSQGGNVVRRKENEVGCSSQLGQILQRVFTFRMIKSLPLIAVCASLTGILEAVLYSFLAFNTYDKTPLNSVLG
jgi:hypothetical protein